MAIHATARASAFTLAAYVLPPLIDQITFRLFSSRISSMFAHEVARIPGFISLIILAEDRRTLVWSSAIFLAYKITTSYFFAGAPVTADRPKTREDQLAALETLIDLLLPQIEKHLSEEGIYRVPGTVTTIREARARFHANRTLPPLTEVHDLIGVLKAQLLALDPPLLQPYYQNFKAAALTKTENLKIPRLVEACRTMTTEKPILKKIIIHLNKVHRARAQNQMDSSNLGKHWVPLLLSLSAEDIQKLKDSFAPMMATLIENPAILSEQTTA
ncbi:MAG: hypothetical protein JSS10_06620 [Verrucomicrobia bacterium]|nr:hypothetical protein [Verrucomicrobiota bacterium]